MDTLKQLQVLEEKIRRLELENRVCRAQSRLFERLVEMAGSASDQGMLKVSMQRTLEVTARLSGTDKGSLFLLNDRGQVFDSLLTRGDLTPEMKSRLIGPVLDQGLAGWVKTHLEVGLIHDTLKDPRWLSLPSDPHPVRSALSVPIIRHNVLFGIITLVHPEPGHFTEQSVEIVRTAASQMAMAIEMARLYSKSEELNRLRKRAVERDLDLARQVQESFLPGQTPRVTGFEFAALNQPAHTVGGDFYHFFNLPHNRLGIVIGDVSGKGMAAALFMARLTSDLQFHAAPTCDPAALFRKLNASLCERSQQGMFVTMIYVVLETDTGRISWVNAGHLPPIIMDETSARMLGDTEKTGPPLGILPDAAWGVSGMRLPPGKGVLLYTDGIVEARNADGRMFGSNRLKRMAVRYSGDPAALVRQVVRAVRNFSKKTGHNDDITLVGWIRKKT
jgi:phosphoserine phosphatase RsbU/P